MVSTIRVLFNCVWVGLGAHPTLSFKYRETNDQKTSFSAYYFSNDRVRWL